MQVVLDIWQKYLDLVYSINRYQAFSLFICEEYMGKKFIFIGLVFASFAVCADVMPKLDEKLLRKEMTQLKDPESAQFRDVKFKKAPESGSWHMCGYVNAKNAFGGYVGFSRFYGNLFVKKGSPHYYIVVSVEDAVANSMCSKEGL